MQNNHLTIGVIARNGRLFLQRCLGSLPPTNFVGWGVQIILVDSGSSDGTGAEMQAWAAERPGTRVFSIEGPQNAAVARNVILSQAEPGGAILFLDGDIVLNPAFLESGLAHLVAGTARAVCGRLEDRFHDAAGVYLSSSDNRYRGDAAKMVHSTGGIVLVSEEIVTSGLRFDEALRRNEDIDYSMRVAERFNLLYIPLSMGLHLTQHYYSAGRINQWWAERYQQTTGELIKKHLIFPRRLAHIVYLERGPFVGVALQILLVVGTVLALTEISPWGLVGAAVLSAADFLRFAAQGRTGDYFPTRLYSPWFMMLGVFAPAQQAPAYTVRDLSR